jgi:hypothetical protein
MFTTIRLQQEQLILAAQIEDLTWFAWKAWYPKPPPHRLTKHNQRLLVFFSAVRLA